MSTIMNGDGNYACVLLRIFYSKESSDGGNVPPVLGSAGSGTPVAPLVQSFANLPTVNSFVQAQSFAQADADLE